jgi:hypothetical protein
MLGREWEREGETEKSYCSRFYLRLHDGLKLLLE